MLKLLVAALFAAACYAQSFEVSPPAWALLAQAPAPSCPAGTKIAVVDGAAVCQPIPVAPPAPLPPVPAAPTYPDQFFTGGMQYSTSTSPHYTGFLAVAKLLSASAGTYSFSGIFIIPAGNHKITTISSTGVAQFMRNVGPIKLYAIGGMGVGTLTNAGAALALNGGMLGVIPIKRGFAVTLMGQATGSGGSTQVVAAVGLGWGR